jgi:hypothetical protein
VHVLSPLGYLVVTNAAKNQHAASGVLFESFYTRLEVSFKLPIPAGKAVAILVVPFFE